MKKIPLEFYQRENVLAISRELVGKHVFTCFDGKLTGGMIVETEAYRAPEDQASHACNFRRTKRNEMMYEAGGVCYLYYCYGIHVLFNIVTYQKDLPHAVLIRAIEPLVGIEYMLERRRLTKIERKLTAGPGILTEALGMKIDSNGESLIGDKIWIEDHYIHVKDEDIVASPRVGITYAGEECARLPWRFRLKNSKWTSLAK